MSSNVINYNTGRTTTGRTVNRRDYMTYDQERRYRAKLKKERQIAKRKLTLLIVTILVIVIGCIVFGSIFSSAHVDKVDKEMKYYKSIEIKNGDTLWDIAGEYASDIYYDSTQDYVDEIKEVNGLTSNMIHQGQHLIVVYYE